MIVFEYEDYKTYVVDRLQEMPDRGRGQFTQIARHLRAPPSTISLVFGGDRDLTPDQASDLCVYFGMSEHETDYLLSLVELSRAASKSLKENLRRRLSAIKKEAAEVKSIVSVDKVLGLNDKFIFYSDWCYSATRLLTSCQDCSEPFQISQRLGIPLNRVNEILQFLIVTGLCLKEGSRLKMGPRSTHIAADDPLVFRHHKNWRELSLNRLTQNRSLEVSELSFTCPCSISTESMERIKKELLLAIEKVDMEMEKSKEDFVAYLNIDFFRMFPG